MLQLPTSIQRLVGSGELSAGHARAILGVPDRKLQEELAEEVVRSDMSVRQVEERVRKVRDSASDVVTHKSKVRHKLESEPNHRKSPGVLELENLLQEHLDTEVIVSLGPTSASGIQGGKIQITFGSIEDLERIFRLVLHR